jgi:enoyl-CoA hydratase/carnithine racemase
VILAGYEHLRVEHGNGIATVTLARPDSRNALNAGLIEEIKRCMEELAEDDGVRVVVLTGEGDFFCAGADIGYMREAATFSYEENQRTPGTWRRCSPRSRSARSRSWRASRERRSAGV